MEKHYYDEIEAKNRENREMKNREMRREIEQYKQDPYKGSIIKLGNYNDIRKAQEESEARLREVLKGMSSLQDKVGELVEIQKGIKEALEINNPQNHVDKHKEEGQKGEER